MERSAGDVNPFQNRNTQQISLRLISTATAVPQQLAFDTYQTRPFSVRLRLCRQLLGRNCLLERSSRDLSTEHRSWHRAKRFGSTARGLPLGRFARLCWVNSQQKRWRCGLDSIQEGDTRLCFELSGISIDPATATQRHKAHGLSLSLLCKWNPTGSW